MKIVDMMDSDNAPGHRILLQVNNILDTDPFNIFSGDAASIEMAVNELHTFLSVEDDAISGIPVRILKYQTEGLGGDEIAQNYYYTNGDNRYLIQCTYSASLADTCEKLFHDIIGSYTITAPSEPAEPTESVRNYTEVTWEELMRYSEEYIGKGISISSATVSQIFKDSNEISVIDSDYNAFVIDYSDCGIERVLEDDPVSIQGVYQGTTEMTRAIGDVTVDLPLIKADSIVVEGLVDREAWSEDNYVGTWQDATGAYQMEITFNGDVFSLEASYQNDNTGDWRMWSLEGWQEGNFDAVPSIFYSGIYVDLYLRPDGTVGGGGDQNNADGVISLADDGTLYWSTNAAEFDSPIELNRN